MSELKDELPNEIFVMAPKITQNINGWQNIIGMWMTNNAEGGGTAKYHHDDTVKALQDKVAIAVTVLESRDRLRADIEKLRAALNNAAVVFHNLNKSEPESPNDWGFHLKLTIEALEKTMAKNDTEESNKQLRIGNLKLQNMFLDAQEALQNILDEDEKEYDASYRMRDIAKKALEQTNDK